jgi:signal transduction histidine kinase
MTIDPFTLAVMVAHLAYSVGLYVALAGGFAEAPRLVTVSTWTDVLFGAFIALLTEGATSPFNVFFAFAVVAVGLRAGLGSTLVVTAVSAVLYSSLIAMSAPHHAEAYIMRPVYLAITGYLVGYLGQQRLNLEEKVRELENTAQRERIARSLHDGYSQTLAAVNLRLETCRKLLGRQRHDDALRELTDLQASVTREHDQLRAYIRSLIDMETSTSASLLAADTEFEVHADFGGPTRQVEHVLQIMLEGTRNVARHAKAKHARVVATVVAGRMQIVIEDDGVGFPADAPVPWSIASRAAELDGNVALVSHAGPGAHLLVELAHA